MSTYYDILNALKDSDQFALLSIDQDYICTLWSKGLTILTDLDENDSIGKNLKYLFPALLHSEHLTNISHTFKGEKIKRIYASLLPFSDKTGVFEFEYTPTYSSAEITGCLISINNLGGERSYNEELQRYQIFSNNTDVGIWEINTKGLTQFINPAMCRMLDVASIEDLSGQTFHSFFSQESLDRMNREHKKRPRHLSSNYEAEIISTSGKRRNVLVNGSPLFDAQGEFRGLIGAFIDITEQKNFENELINSEQRFRLLFEKTYRANAISRDFRILYANESFAKIFGYETVEEIMEARIDQLYTEETIDIIKRRISAIERGEKVPSSYVSQGRKKDGTVFYIENDVTPIELKDGKAFFLSLKDITENINAKNKLIASEAKFSGIFNSNLIGIAFSNDKKEIIDANERFLNIIQYSHNDLRKRNLHWENITPEEFQKADQYAEEELAAEGWISPYEKEYICKDGSRTPVLVGATRLNGSLQMNVSFAIDISELRKSKEETSRITKELSTFLYMTSHDLKGPLATIIGLTLIAQQDIKDPVSLNYFKLIEQTTKKLDNSLMALLKIMQIKNNEFYFTEINIEEMLNEIIAESKREKLSNNIKLNINLTERSAFISDKEMLKTIFHKLMDNAIKYAIPGIIPEILLSVTDNEDILEIKVADRGKGINEKNKDKLFDMFYRGEVNSKGSGLGLYIVKGIVDKLQGTIQVRNRSEGGTEFLIELPRKQKAQPNQLK